MKSREVVFLILLLTINLKAGIGVGISSKVQEKEPLPNEYLLMQNYPNPFNPSTIIGYEIQDTRFVSLKVYNILGENVATLVDGKQNAGSYEVQFYANNLASGFYFYRLETSSFSKTMKMLLLK